MARSGLGALASALTLSLTLSLTLTLTLTLRLLSEDEFQVAWESAVACGLADVVLADQEIGTTGRRFGAVLLATLGDLLTPSGWRGVAADLRLASRRLPTFACAALHGKLLAGVPLAVARYLYQSPAALPFVLLSGAALALAAAVDEATGAVASWEDGVVSAAVTAGRHVIGMPCARRGGRSRGPGQGQRAGWR